MTPRFSANLGFLWTDRPLTDAICAAAEAGFDAVECHWPYATPAKDVKLALDATGLAMLGLNTVRGDVSAGENGLAALAGREMEAHAAIDQAIVYAGAIGAKNIHVMAGVAAGDAARETYVANLRYATKAAAPHGLTILIEPLNRFDAPGYFLRTCAEAAAVIDEIRATNLKLMFDCYHVARTEGDVIYKLRKFMPIIGHIQIAAVPTRAEPDTGDLDYRAVLAEICALGFDAPLGAEYKPAGVLEAGLGWMKMLRAP